MAGNLILWPYLFDMQNQHTIFLKYVSQIRRTNIPTISSIFIKSRRRFQLAVNNQIKISKYLYRQNRNPERNRNTGNGLISVRIVVRLRAGKARRRHRLRETHHRMGRRQRLRLIIGHALKSTVIIIGRRNRRMLAGSLQVASVLPSAFFAHLCSLLGIEDLIRKLWFRHS